MLLKLLRSHCKPSGFSNWLTMAVSAFMLSLTFSKAFVEITFLAMLFIWGGFRVYIGDYKPSLPGKIWIPFFVFLGLVIATSFFSEYPKNSFRGLLKILKHGAVFFIVFDALRDNESRSRFEKIFLAISWLVLINGLAQYTLGRDFLRWKAGEPSGAGLRISGSFGSYGMLAAFLITVNTYMLALGDRLGKAPGEYAQKALAMIVSFGLMILLFLTRSRGAILAYIVSVTLILLFQKKIKILCILLLVCGIFVSTLPRNILIHLDADFKEQSLVERFYLWDRALQVIRAKPITGTGINTYNDAHAKYDMRKNWRVKNYYAHNGYLQLAAETGIPCLASFLYFIFMYFHESLKRLKVSLGNSRIRWSLLTGLLAFLIFCGVDTALQSPQPVMIFWFFMGLQMAYAAPKSRGIARIQQNLD